MGGGLGKSAQVRLTPGSPENRASTGRHHPSAGSGVGSIADFWVLGKW
jgi:hypothetical protein